jgi:hypothetical protein
MTALLDAIRMRLLPALVTALGVVIITAGLLSYADPATAGTAAVESQGVETAAPTDAPGATIEPPSASATTDPGPSTGPSAPAGPSATPTERAVATRVVIPALKIDLPVIRGPDGFPYCGVAMYLSDLGQPGEGRATYLYAHARDGMFGPIYRLAIQQHKAKKMLGMIVQVYTSDNRLYLYEIQDYFLHALDLDAALAATSEQLWLQTSEGPCLKHNARGECIQSTPGKTQLRAVLLSVGAADEKDANPKPKPVACG